MLFRSIMGFVEMLNVSDNDICDTKYTIRNILIKPNSEEEHSIYVEIELDVSCNAIREEEIEILEDLYSPSMNLEFNSRNIVTMVDKKNKSDVYEIREKMQIQELAGEKIRDIRITPNINSATISRGKIKYDGEIKVDFLITSNSVIAWIGLCKLRKFSTCFPVKCSAVHNYTAYCSTMSTNKLCCGMHHNICTVCNWFY